MCPRCPEISLRRIDTDNDAQKMWLAASRFGYIGIFFGVAIVIGFLAGRWLDRRFGCEPWLASIGVLVGVAASFKELIQLARRYQKEQDQT